MSSVHLYDSIYYLANGQPVTPNGGLVVVPSSLTSSGSGSVMPSRPTIVPLDLDRIHPQSTCLISNRSVSVRDLQVIVECYYNFQLSLQTPVLGIPTAGTLPNCTGNIPIGPKSIEDCDVELPEIIR